MREEFEKWCRKNKWNTFRYPESWENGGEYCDPFVNGAWYAFQEQQKKIDEIKELMNEYYTGSFSTIEELAGEISAALTGTED